MFQGVWNSLMAQVIKWVFWFLCSIRGKSDLFSRISMRLPLLSKWPESFKSLTTQTLSKSSPLMKHKRLNLRKHLRMLAWLGRTNALLWIHSKVSSLVSQFYSIFTIWNPSREWRRHHHSLSCQNQSTWFPWRFEENQCDADKMQEIHVCGI